MESKKSKKRIVALVAVLVMLFSSFGNITPVYALDNDTTWQNDYTYTLDTANNLHCICDFISII